MKIEDIAETGLALIAGYLLGLLIKKALKIALILIAAVVIVNLIIHGEALSKNSKELGDAVKTGAGKLIVENSSFFEEIRLFLKAHASAAVGFFAGLIAGLLRG